MVNGQTLNMVTSSPRAFTGGIQRDSAVAQGYQPKTEELEEGVTLKISPLLSFEGDTIDAAVVLTTNNVRTFHQTRVLAPREVGPGELRVDVPEVSETTESVRSALLEASRKTAKLRFPTSALRSTVAAPPFWVSSARP